MAGQALSAGDLAEIRRTLMDMCTEQQQILSDVQALMESHCRAHTYVSALQPQVHSAMVALQLNPKDDPEIPSLPSSLAYDSVLFN